MAKNCSNDHRLEAVFDRAEAAITLIRTIRNRVQKGKHIDPSEFSELNEIIGSLRHNCEMYNNERLQPPTGKTLMELLTNDPKE